MQVCTKTVDSERVSDPAAASAKNEKEDDDQQDDADAAASVITEAGTHVVAAAAKKQEKNHEYQDEWHKLKLRTAPLKVSSGATVLMPADGSEDEQLRLHRYTFGLLI
jgi:hypothetical protein